MKEITIESLRSIPGIGEKTIQTIINEHRDNKAQVVEDDERVDPVCFNTLHNDDFYNVLPRIRNNSVDLIFADLPYGTTQNNWDTELDLITLWAEYKRIIKPEGTILLFAQAPFDKKLAMSNPKWFRYEWIWKKNKATGFLNARRAPLKCHESILVFYDKQGMYNPQMQTGKPYISHQKENNTGDCYGDNKEYTYVNICDKSKKHPFSFFKAIKQHDMDHTTNDASDMKTVVVRRVLEYEIQIPEEAPESDAVDEAKLRTTSEASRERFEHGIAFEPETPSTSTRLVSSADDLSVGDPIVFLNSNAPGKVIDLTSRSVKAINFDTGDVTSFVRSDNTVWGGSDHIRDVIALAA